MKKQLSEVIYTPESLVRNPVKLVQSMFQDLMAARELAWRLAVRDISTKYRESVLGLLWAFIPPILAGIVFIFLHNKKVVDFGDVGMPYAVFAFVGTTLWQSFVESINSPLQVVNSAKPMLAKINFPREALIISAFYQSLFGLLIKSLLLGAIVIYFDINVSIISVLFIIPAILLVLLGIIIGLLLTPLGALYSDVSSSVLVFTQFLFFLTPVVYAPPTTYPYSLLASANPVSPFLNAARDILVLGTINNLTLVIIASTILLMILFAGWLIYRLAMPIIIERISA